jgi:uncharacterized protein YpmB
MSSGLPAPLIKPFAYFCFLKSKIMKPRAWIVKYSGNIFSITGIILTIYFGAFYVPKALREAEKEKVDNAERNIIQSVKELTYSDSLFTFQEVRALIQAEETRINEPLPHAESELLTAVQGSFMQDKFLSLDIRRKLIRKLEIIKTKLQGENNQRAGLNVFTASSDTTPWAIFSIIVTIIITVFGSIALYFKSRNDRDNQEEVSNDLAESNYPVYSRQSYELYEAQIAEAIREYPGVQALKKFDQLDYGFDLEFLYRDLYYYVEIKYLQKSNVGLKSINRFINNLKGVEGNFWFIYNTEFTPLVADRVAEVLKISTARRRIEFVHLASPVLMKEKLKDLLDAQAFK